MCVWRVVLVQMTTVRYNQASWWLTHRAHHGHRAVQPVSLNIGVHSMNCSNPRFKTFTSRQSLDYERRYTDGPLDPPSVIGLSELRQLVADDNYGDL